MSPNAIDPRRSSPYRIYFWSNENLDTQKPPHVHVESGDGYAEFWLDPVRPKTRGSYTELDSHALAGRSSGSSGSAWRPGSDSMAVDEPVVTVDARARKARVAGRTLVVSLVDGRELRVPVRWFPRLAAGTAAQLANLRITEGGRALHWPDLDEDLGVEPLLATAG